MRFSALLLLLFTVNLFGSTESIAPTGYEIKVKIEGLKANDMLKIGYHFGKKQYLKDSTQVNNKGVAIFKGDEPLDGGVYFVILPEQKGFFEFLMNEQHFSMETKSDDLVGEMKVKGSEDNELFFDNMRWNKEQNEKIKALQDKKEKANEKEKKKIDKEIEALSIEAKERFTYFQDKYPDAFFTKIITASSDVILPKKIADDKTKSLAFYKDNYFNNFDFADGRLARTAILPQKVDYYMSQMIKQVPDTVINACDKVIALAQADTNAYKIVVTQLLNSYAKPKVMGLDEVYVHLVDTYYNEEDAWWIKPADLFRIQDRASKIKPTLIGNKAKDFRLKDTAGEYHRLYDVKTKYTIIYFWDPDCGHCRKTTPKLLDFVKENQDLDMTVFTITTEHEEEKWVKYMEKNTQMNELINLSDFTFRSNFRQDYDVTGTPRIFVLDLDKKIVAKKIAPAQIRPLIERHEKNLETTKK